jgi:hypothetical protein
LGLIGSDLGLAGSCRLHLGTVDRLTGAIFRLARTGFVLTWTDVWLARSNIIGLTGIGLTGAIAGLDCGSGALSVSICGDGTCGCDHRGTALVLVVELLPILGGLALVLDLR